MKKIKLMTLVIALSMFSSCGKDDKPEQQPEKTNMEKIVGKRWMRTTEIFAGKDEFPGFPECNKDDLFIFGSDGKYIVDNGAIKCEPDDAQTFEGGKFFIKDNLLTQEINEDFFDFTITQLDDKTMILTGQFDGGTLIRNYVAK